MKKDITLYYNAVCKEHSYDNGFCTKCGGYQPADYNESTGSYEIGNGGQMFWFAALVNGDGEHTQIQEAKPDAHGALVSDISLKNSSDENYEWKPIGEFKGIFDGQNHTISDFSMTKVNDQSIGFFQNLMSDPNETDEASLMFSHTKRRYCKFFDYWKYSLKDGTYFAKEDSDEKQRRTGAYSYERIFACE